MFLLLTGIYIHFSSVIQFNEFQNHVGRITQFIVMSYFLSVFTMRPTLEINKYFHKSAKKQKKQDKIIVNVWLQNGNYTLFQLYVTLLFTVM